MGYGRMNVWIRDERCRVVDGYRAHLHVRNCHGEQVWGKWFSNGHVDVRLPPGCYILTAGVNPPTGSNVYTDKTMVVVSCDQRACVNLVLSGFKEKAKLAKLAPIARGCVPRLLGPLALHARDIGAAGKAAGVLLEAAGIDPKDMAAGLREEAKFLKKNKKQWADDPGDWKAYLKALGRLADEIDPRQQKG